MSEAPRGLTIGIDASSLAGGGRTHLGGVLGCATPEAFGITRVRVWARQDFLDGMPDRPWLERVSLPAIEGPRWRRLLWQRFGLRRALADCDLFWSPGAFLPFSFDPTVVMTQNSLLFDLDEQARYRFSWVWLRLRVLRRSQLRSVRRAAGVIFLTDWGETLVRDAVAVPGLTRVIPHGIDERFLADPRPQHPLSEYSAERPMRLVYVSIIDLYKHQWNVARAVADLRAEGLPLEIRFVGPAYPPALARFERTLDALDPERRFLHYDGPVPYESLPDQYAASDVCVFASTCENLPNILLEAMGSAMPIACSDRSPMREVIEDAGVAFDPESTASIANAIRTLAGDPDLRARCARRARELAAPYTWQRCSDETFRFLAEVARDSAGRRGHD